MKILVIDDDDFVRAVMVQTLKAAGYEIEESSDGADAIQRLKTNSYDIIVTDIVMPGQSGISVGEYVRNNNLPISILAVSVHGDDGGMLDFANYYADDTLQKPFKKEDFLKAVKGLSQESNVNSAFLNM